MSTQPRLGELLIEAGVITEEQLQQALGQQARTGGRLGTNLVELGYVDEKTLSQVLSRQMRIPSATAAQIDKVSPDVLRLLPPQMAEKYRAIPLREDSGRLWVAMAEPTDREAIEELARATGLPVRPMVAAELLIQYGLEKHYQMKRRPRVVEMRTAPSDLQLVDAAGKPIVGGPPADAPTYHAIPPPLPHAEERMGFLDQQQSARVTMEMVTSELCKAESDEAVFDVGMRFVGQDVRRLLVLVLRSGELCGWRAHRVEPSLLRDLKIAPSDLPHVAQAMANGEVFIGRLAPSVLGRLAPVMRVSQEVLAVIVPVRIGKRAVGCMIGLEASLDALRQKAEFDRLAFKLDQALHVNYLRRLLVSS